MTQNDIVDIYLDYQTEMEREGVAQLIELKRVGLPFINQDIGDTNTDVYSYEVWIVEWKYHPRFKEGDRSMRKIRTYLGKGIYKEDIIIPEEEKDNDYEWMF